jgi:hypothetical protein
MTVENEAAHADTHRNDTKSVGRGASRFGGGASSMRATTKPTLPNLE